MVANALMLQFLAWVSERPRTRADVLEAWRSTCPRLSIWEDATIDGLVCIDNKCVTLTPSGRAVLEQEWSATFSTALGERPPPRDDTDRGTNAGVAITRRRVPERAAGSARRTRAA